MWGLFKVFGAIGGLAALIGSCTSGLQDRADKVDHFLNPPVCEDSVDGTTGTTVIDGVTFGRSTLPDGTPTLTRELGECH